jgi:ribosome-binding protein aMBF1 (putative translation factor)
MSIDIQIKVVCEVCGAEIDAYSARITGSEDVRLTVDPCEKCAAEQRDEYNSLKKASDKLDDQNNDLCDQIYNLQQQLRAVPA